MTEQQPASGSEVRPIGAEPPTEGFDRKATPPALSEQDNDVHPIGAELPTGDVDYRAQGRFS